MKGCSVHILFPQWWRHWEHLATSSLWSCRYSSAEVCHLKEVLRSAQHSGHPRLSAGLTCTCLESVRTCICTRKLRACPLLQALLGTRFCRCTLKWSAFPSVGSWSSSVSSAAPLAHLSSPAGPFFRAFPARCTKEVWPRAGGLGVPQAGGDRGAAIFAQPHLWREPQESLFNVITVFSDIQSNEQQ